MTELSLQNQQLSMTSREIAELTDKDISHVHRDIREMLADLQADDPKLDHPKEDKDDRGYTTCFHLDRELTYTLLTGYSAVMRNRVVKRWLELEVIVQQQAQQLLTTTQEQLKLSHREANRWQDKVIYLEAEQLQRASTIEDAKATKVTDLRQQVKGVELKATNLNKTIQQLLQQVSTLENALKDQKELTEDAQHEARTAQIRLRAAM